MSTITEITAPLRFNRTPRIVHPDKLEATQREIAHTPGLHRASLEDALLYGGDVTRRALTTAPLQNNKPHIVVDVKVHMLLEGMYPAIPGWHTDGAPRSSHKPGPDLWFQNALDDEYGSIFHLMVTGTASQTEFIDGEVDVRIPTTTTPDTYSEITRYIERNCAGIPKSHSPDGQWVTFDWWDLHRGVAANQFEWRYLIRITESYDKEPHKDLRKVIRTQQQAYLPMDYGW